MGTIRRPAIRAAALAAGVAAVLTITATPAAAHYSYHYHGSDFASINSGHSTISVCNREADGHAVFANVVTTRGTTHTYQDSTENGACKSSSLVQNPWRWRLCEATEPCTRWEFV